MSEAKKTPQKAKATTTASVKLPPPGGEGDGDPVIYGAWLTRTKENGEPGDSGTVQVYVSPTEGVVIGHDRSITDERHGSELALSVRPDGSITFQSIDRKGKIKISPVKPEKARQLLLHLLKAADVAFGAAD